MRWFKAAAGVLMAGCIVLAHADTVLNESFEDVAGLAATGWVFTNASSPAGLPWFQGNEGIFGAQSGTAGSYAAASFNSTGAVAGIVDNWLISPELALGTGAKLQFWTRASDVGYLDLLEVQFSGGASTALSSFATVAVVGDPVDAAYPVGAWVAFSIVLPTAVTGRFAFHYSVADASDASYIGVDSVKVTTVPEPATLAMFGIGLALVGGAARRRALRI